MIFFGKIRSPVSSLKSKSLDCSKPLIFSVIFSAAMGFQNIRPLKIMNRLILEISECRIERNNENKNIKSATLIESIYSSTIWLKKSIIFSAMIFSGKSSGHINFLKFRSVDFSESKLVAMQKALKLTNRYIWECPLRGFIEPQCLRAIVSAEH
jgi:hypothetical protein